LGAESFLDAEIITRYHIHQLS